MQIRQIQRRDEYLKEITLFLQNYEKEAFHAMKELKIVELNVDMKNLLHDRKLNNMFIGKLL